MKYGIRSNGRQGGKRVFQRYAVFGTEKNLIKIFKDYGVTDETAQDLAEESGPYFYLLDRKTGELSEEGRKEMEYWKDCLGDPVKEISFNNVMIGD